MFMPRQEFSTDRKRQSQWIATLLKAYPRMARERHALQSGASTSIGGTMKLDLLAMAAHPDDVELTCGGTLIKMARRGHAVGILDLTGGEMGTRGSVEMRRKEAAAAARILGVAHRENLGLPDAHLEMRMDYKLAIARRIRALRPRTVILPYWDGRHPDHYTAARLGYEGCFLAGLKQLPIEGEAFRPFKILYSTVYYRP